MEEGKYEEAISLFETLEGYKDSEEHIKNCEKAIETAATYDKAIKLMEEGKYEEAISLFETLEGYKDSEEQIKFCEKALEELKVEERYEKASNYLLQREYEKAAAEFKSLSGYKDSDSKYTEAMYHHGLVLFGKKEYVAAVNIFNGLGDYEQSKLYLHSSQYWYVKTHLDNTDPRTYSYLKDLINAEVNDSESIFKELYTWKVKDVYFNTSEISETRMTEISKYDPVYCYLSISGGEPGGSFYLHDRATYPDGSLSDMGKTSYRVSSGDSIWFGWEESIWTEPEYAPTGTLKINFFDEDNNMIGSGSVKITD